MIPNPSSPDPDRRQKINLDFYFHTSLWCLKRFREGLKDTHREKASSNKTPALRKSTNMDVWAVGALNQLFIRGS